MHVSTLSPPNSSPLMPGYRLDRYELLAPIAEGGMGQVWIARLVGKFGFEKLVAIKTLLPKYASDPSFREMFLDEARIASGVEHLNVGQILDLGEERNVLYLVMEWIDGDSLAKIGRVLAKKQVPLPIGVALRVMADTCAGVHAAHELRGPDGKSLNVVHRDISPQNVLLAANGVAKLIDFGIAKARDRKAGETSEGMLKGKIPYMAPEQALGTALDARTDIWAIGATLYHLLARRPVYKAETEIATLRLLITGEPPPPLPPEIPEPVRAVVMKALAQERDGRFADALEMQRAIRTAMSEARLDVEAHDVAAFVAEHMGERIHERRAGIDLALKAAADRATMNELLRPVSDAISSNGQVPAAPRVPAAMAQNEHTDTALTPYLSGDFSLPISALPKRAGAMIVAGAALALIAVLAVTWLLASSSKRELPREDATARAPEASALGATAPSGESAPAAAAVPAPTSPPSSASGTAAAQTVASAPLSTARPARPRGSVTTEARPSGSVVPPAPNATRKPPAAAGDPDFGY